jgi:hypothetical protein
MTPVITFSKLPRVTSERGVIPFDELDDKPTAITGGVDLQRMHRRNVIGAHRRNPSIS